MLDPQASRFWQAALLSELMDARSLNACWNAIPPEKRDAPEHLDRRLARQAVHAKALTLWQAQQLLAGRTTGFRVDRYVLMDLIGQGGMGRVYLAVDSRLNRRVALKILSPERVNNPRAIARFQREARVGAQLQHENLVRIYDFGESGGRYYLVMEYIEGKTIGTLLTQGGPMPPPIAVHLVRQVALGLEHAHRKGLIHRDVNPFNILVTHDGNAKLADMGLAIDLAEVDQVTREGATVGTFDYVAPEQARHSHSADIRSDIYSLGCTLYHIIAGQVPFPTPSLPEKLFAHQAMDPTPLSKLVPGLSEGLTDVVGRMMRKAPEDRYASPLLVAQALEPFEIASNCFEDGKGVTGPIQPVLQTPLQSPLWADEVPRFNAQSQAAAAKGGAAPASLQAAPAARPDIAASAGAMVAATETPVSTLTPTNDPGASDPDFPLLVNLGPEPSLSEGLSRPRSRFAGVFSTTTGSATTPQTPVSNTESTTGEVPVRPFFPPSSWFWGLVALPVVALLFLAFFALFGVPGFNSERPVKPGRPDLAGTSETQASRSGARRIERTGAPATAEKPFVVRLSDEEIRFDNLGRAVETAMAHHAYVELRNREPYHLRDNELLDFQRGMGKLDLRAGPGIAPIIEGELKGLNSLLTTGSSVPLELHGITIVVHYPDTVTSAPAPIIKATCRASIDRCAFKVAANSCPSGSRAIVFEGDVLEVNRSWFEGFDEAIDITFLSHKSRARVQQTMIVPASGRTQADSLAPEWHGWGVQVRNRSQTKATQPQLVLDHCTVEGAGMLDMAPGPSAASIQAEVKHCAIKAEALLAYKPSRHGEPLTAYVQWSGTGNLFDISGRDWITLSTRGTPVSSIAVNDLNDWLKVATENDPIRSKLTYVTAPTARSNPLKPHDFAIRYSGSPESAPGADPDSVGPSSNSQGLR